MRREATTPITRDTPPEHWPAFLRAEEVATLLGLSVKSVREQIKAGHIPRVPLQLDNILVARGTVLRLACLAEGVGDAQELARRQAAVTVARERLGRLSGDVRVAEEELRLAEDRLNKLTQGGA